MADDTSILSPLLQYVPEVPDLRERFCNGALILVVSLTRGEFSWGYVEERWNSWCLAFGVGAIKQMMLRMDQIGSYWESRGYRYVKG